MDNFLIFSSLHRLTSLFIQLSRRQKSAVTVTMTSSHGVHGNGLNERRTTAGPLAFQVSLPDRNHCLFLEGIVERLELLALDYHLGRGKLELDRAGDIVMHAEKIGVGQSPAVARLGLQFES